MAPSIIVPTRSVNGVRIPTVGYGTMLFPDPDRAAELIQGALECGYRHIDTARKYGSEEWVGAGIRASGLARKDIWVTTKVTEENAKADDFKRSVDTSLKTMGLDYVDLLLIHWPQPKVPLEETLDALAEARRDGVAVEAVVGVLEAHDVNGGHDVLVGLALVELGAVRYVARSTANPVQRGGLRGG